MQIWNEKHVMVGNLLANQLKATLIGKLGQVCLQLVNYHSISSDEAAE